MPTYQYECSECDAFIEVVQSFTDAALTQCEACGQPSLRKVYGAVGVVFKGSGFYKTDSRGSSSSSTKSVKDSVASSAASTSTSTDSQSSTTPSPKSDSSSATSK